MTLPVHAARPAFLEALARGPVVLSSPTGSGKSTEVPRWCEGRVLVIEPPLVKVSVDGSKISIDASSGPLPSSAPPPLRRTRPS